MENPVFFPPNLENFCGVGDLSTAERYRPSAPKISRKEGSCMDGVAGTHMSHAHGGKRLSGD